MLIRNLFLIFIVTLISCSSDSNVNEVFQKEFPSDKTINEEDIESNLIEGYYFVKLKGEKDFNLVCKKDSLVNKGCIDIWGGLTVTEFMRFDPIINSFYSSGLEVAMISKEVKSQYLIRLTKKKVMYKDIVLVDSGTNFVTLSEKAW